MQIPEKTANIWSYKFEKRCPQVQKGKRERGAAGQRAVFGLLKRNGKDCGHNSQRMHRTLMSIIEKRVDPGCIMNADTFKASTAPGINGFDLHRINHSRQFVEQADHSNRTETFGIK